MVLLRPPSLKFALRGRGRFVQSELQTGDAMAFGVFHAQFVRPDETTLGGFTSPRGAKELGPIPASEREHRPGRELGKIPEKKRPLQAIQSGL